MVIFKKDFTSFFKPQTLYFIKKASHLVSLQLRTINMDYASRYLKIKNFLYNIKFLPEFNSTSNHYSDYTYEKYL